MIKKLVWFLALTIIVASCKVKQRATYKNSRKGSPKVVVEKSNDGSKENDGLYPLPHDTGKFQRFKVGSVEEYISEFSEIAQFEMKAYGIPASITLAQGLLESGFGKGTLALKTNNHFGIKCHKGWQGDFDYYDDDEKGECFRKYNHPMYSYRDHSLFLTSRSRYATLFDLGARDYKKWAKGLSRAGYATDRRYPQKLISLIEKYKLYRFDRSIGDRRNLTMVATQLEEDQRHIVKKGDTLYSISRRYSIPVEEIKRMNNMRDTKLAIGQELIIELQ